MSRGPSEPRGGESGSTGLLLDAGERRVRSQQGDRRITLRLKQ
jgi:hypothetical protein